MVTMVMKAGMMLRGKLGDDEGGGVFCSSTVRVMSPRSWLALLQS